MENVTKTYEKGLCCSCGICESICPTGAITLEYDKNGFFKPIISSEKCTHCGICLKFCPGYNEFTKSNASGDYLYGFSKDSEVRRDSSSGGLCTELLTYLISEKIVDYVTYLTPLEKNEKPKIRLTDDIKNIRDNLGSKYLPVSMNHITKEIVSNPESAYAIVGLPCQIQALRKYFESRNKKNIYLISLFCNHCPSYKATEYIINNLNIGEWEKIYYRGAGWPGYIRFVTKTGDYMAQYRKAFATGFINFFRSFRCSICDDPFGNSADISFADAYFLGEEKNGDGNTFCIIRNKKMLEIMESMQKKEIIELNKITDSSLIKNTFSNLFQRSEDNSQKRYFCQAFRTLPIASTKQRNTNFSLLAKYAKERLFSLIAKNEVFWPLLFRMRGGNNLKLLRPEKLKTQKNPPVKKKLLLIGDYTPTGNYGAIATSEALKKEIFRLSDDFEIKIIDSRSIHKPTPINGWPSPHHPEKISTKKKIFRTLRRTRFVPKIYRRFFGQKFREDIPYNYKQYPKFAEKMASGQILTYEKRLLDWADYVVINGEGNLVHGTDRKGRYRIGGLYILFLAYYAKFHAKKYCAILNHSVDPDNADAEDIIKNTYPHLDKVFVREPCSDELLKKWHIPSKIVPDILFTYSEPMIELNPNLKERLPLNKPYVCIGDSSGLKSLYNKVQWDISKTYSKLIQGVRDLGYEIIFVDGFRGSFREINQVIKEQKAYSVNLNNCSFEELFLILKNARAFISGRWHASILALLSGTPVLLWGADSHKTRGLHRFLNYDYKFFEIKDIPQNIDEMVSETKRMLSDKDLRPRLQKISDTLRMKSFENVSFLRDL